MPENLRLLRSVLEPLDCHLLTATSGEEALAQVSRQSPDLILLDLVMPGMNGVTVLRRLKEDLRTRLIPVVVVTALHSERDKLRAIESGADDFLNKPFSKAELLARAKALLRLKRHTDELEYVETVLISLSLIVESRDPYTEGHCQRLARYAESLGGRLGLPEDSLQALRRGGYLHDIGKIAIPDSIFLKRGRLTEEEWRLMRQHPRIGEEICKPLGSLALVLPIIRSHHERWDGSGYPDGLRGEQIPLLARVLQLADIYDALRTQRPYKGALTPAEALEQMQREAEAGLLDPNLLAVFVRYHGEIVTGQPSSPSGSR